MYVFNKAIILKSDPCIRDLAYARKKGVRGICNSYPPPCSPTNKPHASSLLKCVYKEEMLGVRRGRRVKAFSFWFDWLQRWQQCHFINFWFKCFFLYGRRRNTIKNHVYNTPSHIKVEQEMNHSGYTGPYPLPIFHFMRPNFIVFPPHFYAHILFKRTAWLNIERHLGASNEKLKIGPIILESHNWERQKMATRFFRELIDIAKIFSFIVARKNIFHRTIQSIDIFTPTTSVLKMSEKKAIYTELDSKNLIKRKFMLILFCIIWSNNENIRNLAFKTSNRFNSS